MNNDILIELGHQKIASSNLPDIIRPKVGIKNHQPLKALMRGAKENLPEVLIGTAGGVAGYQKGKEYDEEHDSKRGRIAGTLGGAASGVLATKGIKKADDLVRQRVSDGAGYYVDNEKDIFNKTMRGVGKVGQNISDYIRRKYYGAGF